MATIPEIATIGVVVRYSDLHVEDKNMIQFLGADTLHFVLKD